MRPMLKMWLSVTDQKGREEDCRGDCRWVGEEVGCRDTPHLAQERALGVCGDFLFNEIDIFWWWETFSIYMSFYRFGVNSILPPRLKLPVNTTGAAALHSPATLPRHLPITHTNPLIRTYCCIKLDKRGIGSVWYINSMSIHATGNFTDECQRLHKPPRRKRLRLMRERERERGGREIISTGCPIILGRTAPISH